MIHRNWGELEALRASTEKALMDAIVMIDDFPKPGIRYLDFYRIFDINPALRSAVVTCFVEKYRNLQLDGVAAIGTGGFTLGSLVANGLNLPLYPVRKWSDTVYNAYRSTVGMVYAERELSFSRDIDVSDRRVLLIDDTIATGGSFLGAIDVLSQAGAKIVEIGAVFETITKGGRDKVAPIEVATIVARNEF